MTEEKPSAIVRRVGRWLYSVVIEDGVKVTAEPWRVWGYRRAVAKGKKELHKYIKREARKTVERIEL